MSYLFNNKIGFEDTAIDSFSRLRISEPHTIFDAQHRYGLNGKFDVMVVEGGTAYHSASEGTVKLQVGATAGSKVIRQSRYSFPYQPGKSLLILNSFAMNGGKANLTQRVGYYNDYNGIFFEKGGLQGNSLAFVLRSNVTGSTAETRVYQHEWLGDKLDGSGISGRTLDTTKGNIVWMDVEWLGVGDVRCGFVVDGRFVVAHTFHNENEKPATYMTTACLPVRYEIFNSNAAASGSTLTQICSTVISEGGYEGRSVKHSAGVGLTSSAEMVNLSVAGTYYPIMSIRLNPTRTDAIVVPTQLDIISNDKSVYHYRLLLNATLTGASWVTHPNGIVQFDKSATAFSGGDEIGGGVFTELDTFTLEGPSNFNYQLGKSIGGTADTVTLVISAHGANKNITALMSWEELVY